MDAAVSVAAAVATLDEARLLNLRRIALRLVARGDERLRVQALSLLPLIEAELVLRRARS